jgi:hypothetical protein
VIAGRVLDGAAIRDLAIARSVYGQALLTVAVEHGIPLVLPGVAFQEVWGSAGEPDYPLLDLLLDVSVVVVAPLDAAAARACGVLIDDAEDVAPLLADAHLAVVARERGLRVVSPQPDLVRRLAPELEVDLLP